MIYYVSKDRGDDANAGTYEKPLKNIEVALSRVGPGDCLVLLDGNGLSETIKTVPIEVRHDRDTVSGRASCG